MFLVYPIQAVVYFIVMGIDIAVFFLVIRLILAWRDVQWLVPFNRTGGSIVEKVTTTVGGFVSRNSNRTLSEKGVVFISIVILTVMRYVLVMLIGYSVWHCERGC